MRMFTFLSENFSERELAIIRYLLLCLLYEGSKFICLFALFTSIGMQKEYLIAVVILLSIRNFLGGIHLNHYISCFLFTLIFMSISILLGRYLALEYILQNIILIVMIGISFICGPVTSTNHSALTPHLRNIYKSLGCFVLSGYFILFICKETFIYRNLCFWVIVLQTLQLTVAKYSERRKKKHETVF